MEQSNSISKKLFPFYSVWIAFLIASVVFILKYPKGQENILLNGLHNSFFDIFFYYITYLGDGLFCIAVIIVLLFFSYKKAILLTFSYALSSLVTQILKHVSALPRPKLGIKDFNLLHQVENVQIHSHNSFPSGHATTAFALAFVLSTFLNNKISIFCLAIFAVIVSLSRIYLLQHFLMDVLMGSIVGVTVSLLVSALLEKSTFKNKWWINNSILNNGR